MIIREAKPSDTPLIAKVVVDTWRTAYRGLVPDDYLAGLSYEKREKGFMDFLASMEGKTFLYVAEPEPGAVVGFICGGPERSGHPRYRGEVFAMYVLEEYQRRGAGKLLIQAAVKFLSELGIRSMLVWTLADSPYRAFYDSLGGKQVASQTFTLDGIENELAGYGWDDTGIIPRLY